MDIDINALYQEVRESFEYDCHKHGLAPNCGEYATSKINEMTNDELLLKISWALPTVLQQG